MLNFSQFVNESKDHEFDSIEKNYVINWDGTKYKVEKANHGIIIVKGRSGNIKINKGMWKERGGTIIKKNDSDKDEK